MGYSNDALHLDTPSAGRGSDTESSDSSYEDHYEVRMQQKSSIEI